MGGEGEAGEAVGLRSARAVHRSAGGLPFIPYGLVPVAGLVVLLMVALVPFAFGEIQHRTHLAVQKALEDAGATWAGWRTSGQWVELTGTPPSREAADRALTAARNATAETLLGAFPPGDIGRRSFHLDRNADPADAAEPASHRRTTGHAHLLAIGHDARGDATAKPRHGRV